MALVEVVVGLGADLGRQVFEHALEDAVDRLLLGALAVPDGDEVRVEADREADAADGIALIQLARLNCPCMPSLKYEPSQDMTPLRAGLGPMSRSVVDQSLGLRMSNVSSRHMVPKLTFRLPCLARRLVKLTHLLQSEILSFIEHEEDEDGGNPAEAAPNPENIGLQICIGRACEIGRDEC